MARILNFKSVISEAIQKGDVLSFQKAITDKMQQGLDEKLSNGLVEAIGPDPEMQMVIAVQEAARSYGAHNFSYTSGTLEAVVPDLNAVDHLASFLDEEEHVESYEIHAISVAEADGEDESGWVDLANINESDYSYLFTIYFNTDNVVGECFYIDPDEAESIQEATKSVVFRSTASGGIAKKIKMVCPPGKEWDAQNKTCVIMSSKEKRKRELGSIKGSKKRAMKQVKMDKKREKTMKKRISTLGV